MTRNETAEYFKPLLLCILTLCILIPATFKASHAQGKSGEVLKQLERKEVIPPKKPPAPVIIEEEEKPPVDEIEDGKKIFVKQFKVQGATLIDEETIKARVAHFENKDLTFGEINFVVEMVTNEYRRKGYLIAYAYIPPQEVKDGIVKISVVEGRVGDINVSGNKYYSTPFIKGHLERARKDPSPTVQTLRRALLILNDYPSLETKASLKAGKEPGTADITAKVTDSRPISGGISYDNFGSKTISKNRLGGWLNWGNLLTDGDLLLLRGVTGLDHLDFDRLLYGRGEYMIPVSYNGTKVGAHIGNSNYDGGQYLSPLDIEGKAFVAGAYVTHPIIKEQIKTLEMRFGFDYKDLKDYALSRLNSEDNIRVFSLGLNFQYFDKFQGSNLIGISCYQGMGNFLGGSGTNDPNSSRLNADGSFTKFTADAVRFQKLPGYNHILLRALGQFSNDVLFVAEQFSIGGMGIVRGFPPYLFGGDSGYIFSGELHTSPIAPETEIFNRKLGDVFKFVFFAETGGVFRNDVQPGENKNNHLTSIGAGIRLYAHDRFSVLLDWAVPKIDGSFKTSSSITYVQAAVHF